jgi:hypothetical protein
MLQQLADHAFVPLDWGPRLRVLGPSRRLTGASARPAATALIADRVSDEALIQAPATRTCSPTSRNSRSSPPQYQLTPEARSGGLAAEELYAKLPYQIRDQLSWLDFVDFLDQVRRAGLADPAADDRLILRAPDSARLRIALSWATCSHPPTSWDDRGAQDRRVELAILISLPNLRTPTAFHLTTRWILVGQFCSRCRYLPAGAGLRPVGGQRGAAAATVSLGMR